MRRRGTLLGLKTYYQTPESLILAKLRMIKATLPTGRSLKDREDVKAILQNTKVSVPKIINAARKETTLDLARVLLPQAVKVRARRKWGRETFPDAGEATFGE